MKFLLLVAAVIGLASASNLRFGFQYERSQRDLSGDLQDIRDLIPTEEILAIGRVYLDSDAEVQSLAAFLQGPEWAGLVADLGADAQWQDFKAWAGERGVDVDALVSSAHDLINSWEWVPTDGSNGGVRALVDEVRAVFPTDDVLALVNDKLANSADFQELYGKVSSQEARDFFNRIMEWPTVQYIGTRLRELGIDVDAVLDFIREFLGWA